MFQRVLILSLLLSQCALAKGLRFDMRDAGGRNIVHFISDAPLEKTIGLSNAIAGWIELDPEKLVEGFKGEFEVDVRTFHTGVELRNEHVKDKFMNAAEFPIATFTVLRLLNASKTKLADGVPVTLRVEGTLKAKGVTRTQVILVKLIFYKESELTRQRLPGNLLKMAASFDIDVGQFGVQIPDNQRARFSRFVQVYVDAVGTDRTPASAAPVLDEVKEPKSSP